MPASTMVDRWELHPQHAKGRFAIRPYKPAFVLPVVISNKVNTSPTTPNPVTTVPVVLPLDATEAKFEISMKSKLFEGLFGGHGSVWAGTQLKPGDRHGRLRAGRLVADGAALVAHPREG